MKVLFVSSGNSPDQITPIVKNQGDSLQQAGITIEYFTIKGKGTIGYLQNSNRLKSYLKGERYDLLHAHYGLCGLVALFANKNLPMVLSLMGSDANGEYNSEGRLKAISYLNMLVTKLSVSKADYVIVKSDNIREKIGFKKQVSIVPNGVDLSKFSPAPKSFARKELGLELEQKIILFLGNKKVTGKNFSLAMGAVSLLNEKCKLLAPYPVANNQVPVYLNACDVLLLTSTLEGSPNIIKEAMAVNCPIVATDVGDVRWVLSDTKGCYITSFDSTDVADKLKLAIAFSDKHDRTNGRDRIKQLELDSATIAKKIITIYENLVMKKYGFQNTN